MIHHIVQNHISENQTLLFLNLVRSKARDICQFTPLTGHMGDANVMSLANTILTQYGIL
jgi:hypothetical protein